MDEQVKISKEWTVFGIYPKMDASPSENDLRRIPDALIVNGISRPSKTVSTALTELDLAKALGKMEVGQTAFVYIPVKAKQAGQYLFGFGADWWMSLWCNGQMVFDNTSQPTGNVFAPISIENHQETLSLREGDNLMVVRFVSGQSSSVLAFGGPAELQQIEQARQRAEQSMPWCQYPPRFKVKRTLYWPYKQYEDGRFGAAGIGVMCWGGNSFCRTEYRTYEISSDYGESMAERYSCDNGKTFSEWKVLWQENPRQGEFEKEYLRFANCYDHLRGHDVRFDFQRIFVGSGPEAIAAWWQGQQRMFDHGFYCISTDKGKTFSKPRLLKYEPGEDFDESDWGKKEFLTRNQMYGGYTAIMTRQGKLLYPFSCLATVQAPTGLQKTCGVRCAVGTWDERKKDYVWQVSEPVAVPLQKSGRGLMEPAIAELADGRIVLSMRGSNDVEKMFCPDGSITVEEPGRHWLAVSDDGGCHWSPARDWRYSDGQPFYSPSAFSRLIRHSNGKLYWIGNICSIPPCGNMPRHPLVIAQVDEEGPSLIKQTVTIIDTKPQAERTHPLYQLSNFYILENTETGAIELYLTRCGESPQDWLKANAYKYEIEVK